MELSDRTRGLLKMEVYNRIGYTQKTIKVKILSTKKVPYVSFALCRKKDISSMDGSLNEAQGYEFRKNRSALQNYMPGYNGEMRLSHTGRLKSGS